MAANPMVKTIYKRSLTRAICLLATFPLAILLAGCDSGPYAEYTTSELQDAYHKCESRDSMSPGAAITCDNVRRECDRRADEKGRKVCY